MNIDQLFRKRIGYEPTKRISFTELEEVLAKTAATFPFENLCIIKGNTQTITEENLVEKLLNRGEGGLCYELNPILYLFLRENGFSVSLVSGVVYNQMAQEWSRTGRTHVAILLRHEGKEYLVDTGFGGNIPLMPVLLSGEIIQSANGEFRIKKIDSTHGDYQFEMKRKYKDEEFVIGFSLDSTQLMKDVTELEQMQKVIVGSDASTFNKEPLLTKLTEQGSMTLTNKSFTRWQNGGMTKEDIDPSQFAALAKEHFGLNI